MNIIESYVDLENEVLKTGKHVSEQEVSKTKEIKSFDYNEYYNNQAFDLKNEITKEKAIKDFFKQKYKIESEELAEDKLRDFLDDRITPKSKEVSPFYSGLPIKSKDSLANPNLMVRVIRRV